MYKKNFCQIHDNIDVPKLALILENFSILFLFFLILNFQNYELEKKSKKV